MATVEVKIVPTYSEKKEGSEEMVAIGADSKAENKAKGFCGRLNDAFFVAPAKCVWQTGKADPRRIIHALKVGLALSLSSFMMLIEFPKTSVTETAVWALMTVVVVFEFYVGATLSKGLNRGLGTFIAGVAALGVSHLADLAGFTAERIIICLTVFLAGAAATFARFLPKIKAKYEYGVVIFLLTFSFILVSSHRSHDSIKKALNRLLAILMGCGICVVVCLFVYPIWAGEDLHNKTAENLDNLSKSLQDCVTAYLEGSGSSTSLIRKAGDVIHEPMYKDYQSLIKSSQTEDSLAGFARWEPPHGSFRRFKYPWNEYVKLGTAIRHCAYTSMAMLGCLWTEAQASLELRQHFSENIENFCLEAKNILEELAQSIRNFEKPRPADTLMQQLNAAEEALQQSIDKSSHLFVQGDIAVYPSYSRMNSMKEDKNHEEHGRNEEYGRNVSIRRSCTMKSQRFIESSSAFSLATFVSLLIEFAARLEHLAQSVEVAAKFRSHSGLILQRSNLVLLGGLILIILGGLSLIVLTPYLWISFQGINY